MGIHILLIKSEAVIRNYWLLKCQIDALRTDKVPENFQIILFWVGQPKMDTVHM